MAMTVMNNAGAQLSLGELNKNINNLGKTLRRLSSGQKFDGSDGDGASYVISERMREQIRSLFQDDQNIQNGASMIKTAERGVDQIISNLRTMKEKAIDAANDSNTDEDRRTIQKELDQRRHIINDIALGTQYNGKILLDGRYEGGVESIEKGGGGANTTVKDIRKAFVAGTNARKIFQETNGAGDEEWKFEVDASFSANSGSNFAVELDFTKIKVNGSYPAALSGQGFTILCGGCSQYINVLFDADKATSQSTYDTTPGVTEDGSSTNLRAREFIIGVKGVKNAKALAKAVFDGISNVKDQIDRNGYYSPPAPNTPNDILLDKYHEVRIRRTSNGKVYITKKENIPLQFKEGTIPNPMKQPIPEVKVKNKVANPLWIQSGTRSGQRMHVFIGDMKSKSLGIDAAKVVTKDKANDAISVIEDAIEIALDEATNLGAYLQRFEYTDSNVTTTAENTQASESVIRDADMAKEMASYMKHNLLSQSAQSMLAQANQKASNVLGFLQ